MKSNFIDLIGLTGLSMLGYGLWCVYQPAAFIGCGALLIIYAVMAGTNSKGGD